MASQHATPIIVGPDGTPEGSQPIFEHYEEAWLRNLLFEHPEVLPIEEIDRSFTPAVPVCTELRTQAGYIDALYATPEGRLILLETKLWRNPEARRAVIGQILDYAKELSRWTYADLQREVSRCTERSGNALFDIVAAAQSTDGLSESDFVDEVSRSLRQGRFLLLICGDGIREGVTAITDFLQQHGTLHFTFGLVEVAMYEMPEGKRLVQPRILAQTVTVKRTVVSLESEGLVAVDDDEEGEVELSGAEQFYLDFWKEFLDGLKLADPNQSLPTPSKRKYVFFPMPARKVQVHLQFYIADSQVGVSLWARGDFGKRVFEQLLKDKEGIEEDLGVPVDWFTDDSEASSSWVEAYKKFPDLKDTAYRPDIMEFFQDQTNRFVNVFRHRIKQIAEDIVA